MGCRLTKAEKEEEPKDFDKLEEKTSVPQVDPRLPIDAREAFKLKQSWKGIKRRIEETGVEMFIRYDFLSKELRKLDINLMMEKPLFTPA